MWDVVIVGSGAGGGPLALRLSQAGLNVLVLEKGPQYSRDDYKHDEIRMATNPHFFVPSLQDEPHMLIKRNETIGQLTSMGWIACCVGGGTAHMGGAFYRFHPHDFSLRSRLGSYEAIEDWPFSYDDLEPYYSMAEWEIGVAGAAGSNLFEGVRSRPYPMPPLNEHVVTPQIDRACRANGLHPFPTPRAINSRDYNGRPRCGYCNSCAGYGCHVGARGSTQEALLARAVSTGKCEIRPMAMVSRILTNVSGDVIGCLYFDSYGEIQRVDARVVCVCCSAIESARLLLMSASSSHPDGLANSSGLVGRYLQFHVTSRAHGRFERTRYERLGAKTDKGFLLRSLMDYYFLPGDQCTFPKGGVHKFEIERPEPVGIAQRLALSTPQIVWGQPLADLLNVYFLECWEILLEVFQDYIPNDGTFVDLDPMVRDKWGLPVARIHLDECAHHSEAGRLLVDRGLEILTAAGATDTAVGGIGDVNGVMVHGTCRAGSETRRSVLNQYCQAHDVRNLFVVDGSFMPTSGGSPSTLTIIANSFRTADYIIESARSHSL